MPTGSKCESCGAEPPTTGKFSSCGYCAHCSKDLCDECLRTKRCRDSADHKHAEETDCDSCVGGRISISNETGTSWRKCLDCAGTGTVLKTTKE